MFFLNDKNLLYLIIFYLSVFFEGHNDQGVTQLVIKPFGISQTPKIVDLSKKKTRFFQTPF